MPAYIIFIREAVTDQSEMDSYAAKARIARGEHKIVPLAYYGDVETLEGPAVNGVVVLRFDDMAAARAWYHSPAYQAAKLHRLSGASYRVLLAEGVQAPLE